MPTKKKLYCILDVETAGSLGWPLVYDIAYKIVDKYGKEYASKNFIIKEIFQNPDFMVRAYYARKYFEEYPIILRNPEVCLTDWQSFLKEFNQDMKIVDVFCAYNAAFDLRAIRLTDFYEKFRICNREVLGNFLKSLINQGNTRKAKQINRYKSRAKIPSVVYDIYLGSAQSLLTSREFRKTAYENLWITPNGNISSTAQVSWRWLSKDSSFIEKHTSMEDVIIETEILQRILSRKKKMRYNTLLPACIVSRFAQGRLAAYFHEREDLTFTEYLWGISYANNFPPEYEKVSKKVQSYEDVIDTSSGVHYQVPSVKFKDIERIKNLKHRISDTFCYALEKNIDADEFNDQIKFHQLRQEFKKATGMYWNDFKILPTNFQIITLLDAKGIDWRERLIDKAENINLEFKGPNLTKLMEEKAKMQQEANIEGHLKQTILELSDPQNEATKYIS